MYCESMGIVFYSAYFVRRYLERSIRVTSGNDPHPLALHILEEGQQISIRMKVWRYMQNRYFIWNFQRSGFMLCRTITDESTVTLSIQRGMRELGRSMKKFKKFRSRH